MVISTCWLTLHVTPWPELLHTEKYLTTSRAFVACDVNKLGIRGRNLLLINTLTFSLIPATNVREVVKRTVNLRL